MVVGAQAMAGVLWWDVGGAMGTDAVGVDAVGADVCERLQRLGWPVLRSRSPQAMAVGLRFHVVVVHAPRQAMQGGAWQRALAACGDVPALVLMDPPDPLERVIALELGAAAVVLAPHDAAEVVARVQALVRRAPGASAPPREAALLRDWLRQALEAGQWGLSASERLVLRALLDQPGRVMSRGDLLQRTGLAQLGHQPNVVDLAVSRLRRKLPQWGLQAQGIQTLRGQGYVWAQASGGADAGPW